MIKEEIKNIKESKSDLKKFGITIGIVLLIISSFLFYNENFLFIYFAASALLLILTALIHPMLLKPFNKVWMIFALLLGWLMTRVILSILFYLVVTPIAFLAKICGKKFLDLETKKEITSYWEKREVKEKIKIDYERQF